MPKALKGTLKTWSIVEARDEKRVIGGAVYGHPDYADGLPITTSAILAFDEAAMTIETRNSSYKLGDPYHETELQELRELFK